MSAEAMQSSRQYRQVPTSAAYGSTQDHHYDTQGDLDADGYYTSQNVRPSADLKLLITFPDVNNY